MKGKILNRNLPFRLIFLFIILLVIGIIVYFITYANKGNEVNVTSSYIEVIGIRGEKIEFKDIESVELKDSFPGIEQRLMGSEIGSAKRGSFVVKELGRCILLMDTCINKYIYIKAADGFHIINYGDDDKTSSIFNELKSKFEGFRK